MELDLWLANFLTTCAKSLQSCPTLCDPMDYGPPSFSVHGILQARILEWVAVPFSRGSSPPGLTMMHIWHHAAVDFVCVCVYIKQVPLYKSFKNSAYALWYTCVFYSFFSCHSWPMKLMNYLWSTTYSLKSLSRPESGSRIMIGLEKVLGGSWNWMWEWISMVYRIIWLILLVIL